MTAIRGMAPKYTEVTLAQHYRQVDKDVDPHKWEGSVSGGPMYYIERGLGPKWRPLAIFFAALLGTTAFLTGNAIQANTVADTLNTTFGLPVWITGLATAGVVALVIVGGITRIGKVTGILAPAMAVVYVTGALAIILVNFDQVIPTFALIFREAFNPSAGIAGTGVGAFLVTMMWGVKRGLFSNEAGQGSAPIAHAAAKTDEPVSEGVVALVEPFIDTIVICTMTALVIIMTGVWQARIPTEITLTGGDLSFVVQEANGDYSGIQVPTDIRIEDGRYVDAGPEAARVAWHEVAIEPLFTDPAQTQLFTGVVQPESQSALGSDGATYQSLYADAVESGAPLTMLGFQAGLPGNLGSYIVLLSVLLFAISTAIAWSYYGDRCANYLFGHAAVLPYKIVFIGMHFVGSLLSLAVVWTLGDVFLGLVIIPNLLALILLSPKVIELTKSYFERQPWIESREVHRRMVEERKRRRTGA